MAAGALMFVRGDLEPSKQTVERSYSRKQVMDGRLLPSHGEALFHAGFPAVGAVAAWLAHLAR